MLPDAVNALSIGQKAAAADSVDYVEAALEAQGMDAVGADVAVSAFAGIASDGRALATLLSSPAYTALGGIRDGASLTRALGSGLNQLVLMGQTQVADAGRASSGVAIASRQRTTGYIRMTSGKCCSRCAVLAGRYYRWNSGFLRHPGCACIHIPAGENSPGDKRTDPYKYFESLSREEQNKIFTEAGAEAIRDGADINQVVNARRGMSEGGLTTTEGTGRRGYFRSLDNGPTRLTPEAIYQQAGSRTETLKLLEQNGYILPQGQVSGGAIRGQVEGFGQSGKGGAAVGARNAVEQARATGVRDPNSRYTMTAAEYRAYKARFTAIGDR